MQEAEWVRTPAAGRPVVSASEAARILGNRLITVQKRIQSGRLEGGRYPGKARWWVYADTDPRLAARHRGVADSAKLGGHDAGLLEQELRHQLEETTARWAEERAALEARHRADLNRIDAILALNAETLVAGEEYKSAAEEAAELVQHSISAMLRFKSAADKWMAVSGKWRDLVAAENMPDDLSGIDDLP